MLPLFSTSVSTKQLFDMLEILDVHDAMREQAMLQAKQEAQQKK